MAIDGSRSICWLPQVIFKWADGCGLDLSGDAPVYGYNIGYSRG
jgi:hypothetical protein